MLFYVEERSKTVCAYTSRQAIKSKPSKKTSVPSLDKLIQEDAIFSKAIGLDSDSEIA